MLVGSLPRKLRISLINTETGAAVRYVPLILDAEMRLEVRIRMPDDSLIERIVNWSIQLPVATTDYVGYLSVPLDEIRNVDSELKKARTAAEEMLTVEIFRLWVDRVIVRCPTSPGFHFDLTPQLELIPSGSLDHPMPALERVLIVESTDLTGAYRPNLPSIVEPDTTDWRLSPASFGMTALPIVGEDGCEMLLPSHEADRLERFSQLLRIPSNRDITLPSLFGGEFSEGLTYLPARLVEYETIWRPLNHALGKVVYSLTLAPCEAANVATVDWHRSDTSTRDEVTGLSDSLTHQQRRDRTIDEVLDATVTEWQKGESFLGGTAGVGGYGGQGQGSMWGVTGSHAVGWGTASTEGNREVEASTTQRLADTISQASRMIRDLRSTVVVQSTQSEAETVQTRTVRNHNHSHALTILYYEVVRHYIITTKPTKERDVILIKQNRLDFSRRDVVRNNSDILRKNLLDPALQAAFYDLVELPATDYDLKSIIESGNIHSLLVRIEVGEVTGTFESTVHRDRFRLMVMTRDGRILYLNFTQANFDHFIGDEKLHKTEGGSTPVTTAIFELTGHTEFENVSLSQIFEVGLCFDVQGDIPHQVEIKKFSLRAVASDGDSDKRIIDVLEAEPVKYFRSDSEWWDKPNRLPSFAASDARELRVQTLIEHLQQHNYYYNRAIWLARDLADYLTQLRNYGYPPGSPVGSAADYIDSPPIGIHGDYLAFAVGRYRRIGDSPNDPTDDIIDERIIALPTRGAFAEVQLSHCNASEFIDNRRFWDWQKSPCTDNPPDIVGVGVGSRYQDALSANPTNLPASGVGVESPADAPAPSGLDGMLNSVLGSDVFRNMAPTEQLAGVLTELTKAAADVESKRMDSLVKLRQADAEVQKAKIDATAQQPQASGATTGPSPSPSATTSGTPDTPATGVTDTSTPASPSSGGGGGGGGGTTHTTPVSDTPATDTTSMENLMDILFHFRDARGRALVGTQMAKIYYTPNDTGVQTSVGPRRIDNGSLIRLRIPRDIQPNIIVQAWSFGAELPNWHLLDRLRSFLASGDPIPPEFVHFETVVHTDEGKTIDFEDPSSQLFYFRIAEDVSDPIHVRVATSLQRSIEEALSLGGNIGLGEIEKLAIADAGAEGSISDTIGTIFGAEAEVEADVKLHFLVPRFEVSQGNDS